MQPPRANLLIADSGSTKTDWLLLHADGRETALQTRGINPFQQSEDDIAAQLQTTDVPQLLAIADQLHYYGAGCRGTQAETVRNALVRATPASTQAHHYYIHTDLLGAARALCGHTPGIACILGTGSNSCYYDGQQIVENTPPLGYILGDEGSGATLGRRLIGDILKDQVPSTLIQAFWEEHPTLTIEEIIRRTYQEPQPSRFLASFVPFISKHRQYTEIQHLIADEFTAFLRRNVLPYKRSHLPLHYVGGVAANFKDELLAVTQAMGLKPGIILPAPMPRLRLYHNHL